jgi:hypothetical protein
VASSGDSGAGSGPEWPAVSPNVLAVGGTHLATNGTETGWSGSGGGTSRLVSRPTYQNGFQTSNFRGSPDVSYDADPNTGFQVFNTVGLRSGQSGWFIVGGTSAGAPQWAALIALADQGRAARGLNTLANAQATLYTLPAADFYDVTSGSNGFAAHAGYDLVTGRGSPHTNLILDALVGASGGSNSASTGVASLPIGSGQAHARTDDSTAGVGLALATENAAAPAAFASAGWSAVAPGTFVADRLDPVNLVGSLTASDLLFPHLDCGTQPTGLEGGMSTNYGIADLAEAPADILS